VVALGSVSKASERRRQLIATLIFHQIELLLLHFAGMTPSLPYNMNSVPPFGMPQFISLSGEGGYPFTGTFDYF
jgi:hypothetical protein